MRPRTVEVIVLLLVIGVENVLLSIISNGTINAVQEEANKTQGIDVETRRRGYRSTSSSSGERAKSDDSDDDAESLDMTESSESTDEVRNPKPKSSAERKGWRKWHRKCPPCPEDMVKKWRDPTINWICGAYQRARRSFKSLCMMHYRNCQDGTMFTKIGDHRCKDEDNLEHFLYDYKVKLSIETSKVESDVDTSSAGDESTSFEI